jgi:hypothetical protein
MTRARDLASGLAGVRPFATAMGLVSGGIISSATNYSVTFPANRFTVAPMLVFGIQEDQSGWARASSNTTSGCTITHAPFSGSTITRVVWTAIQMTSSSASG